METAPNESPLVGGVPRRSRASVAGMIIGGLLAILPLLGPLSYTLHYLDDFFAQRPQPTRGPEISFYIELLALLVCPVGLLIFAVSLALFVRTPKGRTKQ